MYFQPEFNKDRVSYLILSAVVAIILHVCVLMIYLPVPILPSQYDHAQEISVSLHRDIGDQNKSLPDEEHVAKDEHTEMVPEPIITSNQIETAVDTAATEDQPNVRLKIKNNSLIPSANLSFRSINDWAGQYVKNQLKDSKFRSFNGAETSQEGNRSVETRSLRAASLDSTDRFASLGFSEVSVQSRGKQRCFKIFESSVSYSDFASPSLALPIKCNDHKKTEFSINNSTDE